MRDRNRGPAQIKSVHQNAGDNTVANARPIWPFRPHNRDDDRHQPDHQSHPNREIGQRLGVVQHVFGADKTGTPEHDKNRRRRARGNLFKVLTHLPPSLPDRMLGGNDNCAGPARDQRTRSHFAGALTFWESTMRLQFQTVDVFTSDRFAGNPLAVVLNAEGLSGQQMQAIAAEFNLAETTFVLPPKDAAHTAEVRIFTPRSEMPFAGHPNVGTAFALAREGISYGRPVNGDSLVFEEKAGLVRMELTRKAGVVVATRLAAPVPLSIGEAFSADFIADACSLK